MSKNSDFTKKRLKKTKEGMNDYVKEKCKEIKEIMDNATEEDIEALTKRERQILTRRAKGANTEKGIRLADIAEELGTTRQNIKILQDKGVEKLNKLNWERDNLFW